MSGKVQREYAIYCDRDGCCMAIFNESKRAVLDEAAGRGWKGRSWRGKHLCPGCRKSEEVG